MATPPDESSLQELEALLPTSGDHADLDSLEPPFRLPTPELEFQVGNPAMLPPELSTQPSPLLFDNSHPNTHVEQQNHAARIAAILDPLAFINLADAIPPDPLENFFNFERHSTQTANPNETTPLRDKRLRDEDANDNATQPETKKLKQSPPVKLNSSSLTTLLNQRLSELSQPSQNRSRHKT